MIITNIFEDDVYADLQNMLEGDHLYHPHGEGGFEIYNINGYYIAFEIHPHGGDPILEMYVKHIQKQLLI